MQPRIPLVFYFYWSPYSCYYLFPTICRGFVVEREKVTPAVGIKFIIEEKIFNLSASYYFRKHGINDYKGMKIKYCIVNGVYVDLFSEDFSDKDLLVPVSTILHEYNSNQVHKSSRQRASTTSHAMGLFQSG